MTAEYQVHGDVAVIPLNNPPVNGLGYATRVAITQDVGQANEDVEASYLGSEMTVAFNPDFLIAGVDTAEGDTITLETIDNLKPAGIRALGRPEFLYLLMPVRVS